MTTTLQQREQRKQRPSRSVVVHWLGGGTAFSCTKMPSMSAAYDDVWDEESNAFVISAQTKRIEADLKGMGYTTQICPEPIAESIHAHWKRRV
jgi:hypothetical protein